LKILSFFFFSSILLAQPAQRLIFVSTDPSGACSSGSAMQWNSTSGNLSGCNSGTWHVVVTAGVGGTVSAFSAGNLSPLFTTSVSSATTTPALSFSASNAAQNSVLAGPASGGPGAPTFQTAPNISMANMTGFSSVCSTCVTSLAALTSTNIVIGAGLKSESASLATVDSSGNIGTPASVSAGTGSGSTGTITALAGTAPVSPGSGNFSLFFNSANSNHLTIKNSSGTLFDLQNYYPSSGIAVSTGSAWSTSLTTPASALVGISDTQTLTNKSISGGEINSGTVLSTYLPSGILYSGGVLGTPSSGNASNLTNFPTLNQNTTGNAATATALASTPSGCTTGQFATAIAASGNLTCGVPGGSGNVVGPVSSTGGYLPQWNGTSGALLSAGLPVGTTGNNTVVETSSGGLISAGIVPTLNQSTSGNAATATYATSAGSATTATMATSATTAGSATTAATASALSAAYIDYNASSGGASIQNKPAAPYGFTSICSEANAEAALNAGSTQLYLPSGCTWVLKHTQWTYTTGGVTTIVPPDSVPPGLTVVGQDWVQSTVATTVPASYVMFISPSTTLLNLNLQNQGCSVSGFSGQAPYVPGVICPMYQFTNSEPRYSGTVSASGHTVTLLTGPDFVTDAYVAGSQDQWSCNSATYPIGMINIGGALYNVASSNGFSITATNNGSPDILTAPGNNLTNGMVISIYGMTGDTAANGTSRVVTNVGAGGTGTFELTGINGNGSYLGGGFVAGKQLVLTSSGTCNSISNTTAAPSCSVSCTFTFDQYHNMSSNGYTSSWVANAQGSNGISLSGFGGGDVIYSGANGYGQTAVRASTANQAFQSFLAQRINGGDGFATIDNPPTTGNPSNTGNLFVGRTSYKTGGSMLELDQDTSTYCSSGFPGCSDAIRVNLGQGSGQFHGNFIDLINASSTVYKVNWDGSISGLATAPFGSCSINGSWMFTQDGKGTVCLAGTWVTKII
jgi:hypothetical protein